MNAAIFFIYFTQRFLRRYGEGNIKRKKPRNPLRSLMCLKFQLNILKVNTYIQITTNENLMTEYIL